MKIINNCLTKVEPSDLIDGKFIFPPEVDSIATYAFSPCANDLIEIEIPDNITHIGTNVFANCAYLKSVKLPNRLKKISDSLFENCKALEYIEIPESVNFIGASAFASCSSLTSINIPKDVKEIYFSTFKNCESLEHIEFGENTTTLYPNAFENCKSLKEIKLPEKLKFISLECFSNCTALQKINLPESLETVKSSAFKNCSSLQNIDLPSTLKELGDQAFESCKSLKEIKIPDNVTNIGKYIFKDCVLLENAEICKPSIGMFTNCNSLKSVTITSPLKKLENSSFENCSSLENIEFKDTVKTIGTRSFSGCKSLKNIKLPEGLTSIKKEAFKNCESLEFINLPSTITDIGENVFENCDSLEYLHIPETTKSFKHFENNSLLFFNKTEDGFNLSANQTQNSIPTKMINLDYSFLSKYWDYKDILLKEQRNPNIADFYNKFVITLPRKKAEDFITSHNFTFFKQFNFNDPFVSNDIFYKILYNLGALERPIINDKGKTVDYAQKVCGFILENVDIRNLNSVFLNMNVDGFKIDFTDFFLKNYLTEEMTKEEKINRGFISRCYNEFEEVQKTNTSHHGSQRQLKPTIQKFKSSFVADKYIGVTEENNIIAQTISPYFDNQSSFENAVKIDAERKKHNVKNNILSEPLKESDVFSSIEDYTKKIITSNSQILGKLTDIAANEFSFEWLEKNDPQNFILGKLCSCCAHLEGVGYGIMHASMVHPNVQNLVIKNKEGEIVAKSTLFINKLGRYGVCNNVEVKNGTVLDMTQIYQKFVLGIREFVKKYNKEHPLLKLKQVNVGMSNNDLVFPIQDYRETSKHNFKALKYGKYGRDDHRYNGDSDYLQYVIWSDKEERKISNVEVINTPSNTQPVND